ncbi:hypothetical protein LHP98_13310 [Rhodobacter sp. Har01]|uniref:hypothetical protein n=1 Tax=Rhodobacter sp. Har01 TaxID=2883999 RepID=UPI001D062FD3|nr:hypothetical protein [Rhodobacter sp. Har01]MCB6179097.1 hypothetical protein [Rhodobacter sp. Har01]
MVKFDPATVTFLHAFAHMVLSVILAIVLFRVTASAEAFAGVWTDWLSITKPAAASSSHDPERGLTWPWLLIAFALGFLPDNGLQHVLCKTGLPFKDRHTEQEARTKIVPLTLLDGVDPRRGVPAGESKHP